VLLPALHHVQHAYNWIPPQAMEELAAFLELSPAEVLDTASFYEEYWLRPKGKYLVQVCRSLSCELCGSRDLTKRMEEKLGVPVGETTPDGRFTLVELECLGACGTAPVALVNEALYENLTPEKLEDVVSQLPGDPHDFKDPTVDWDDSHGH
jgi:NADH-quinone oxidoreductase subunit E